MLEISTIIGYIAVVGAMVFGISYADGGFDFSLLENFISGPSVFITIGGTFFALLASFPFSSFKRIPAHIKMVMSKDKTNPYEYIETITELSREARKKGLLALEDKALAFEDEFLKESVLLIVDAIEPDKLKIWFGQKLDYMRQRNNAERHLYDRGAAFGPAFGMIGTLIGLVNMLKSMNLDEGPEMLGLNMSVALITTFYGSLLANAFFIPMSNKLEIAQEKEMLYKEMIVEGVVSIKEGENPKYIQEKLMNFLDVDRVQQKETDPEDKPSKPRKIGIGRQKQK
ncbi:MAG: motility protein A [Clostridiales bacterium]|nr:motility protein A [Clostridiales bacterium]